MLNQLGKQVTAYNMALNDKDGASSLYIIGFYGGGPPAVSTTAFLIPLDMSSDLNLHKALSAFHWTHL